ncbi:MAG: hypothetical protein NTX53_18155 [candidate division WOR-3 bacterium]|nr:hypothetical protein [candidate division WOR-3 bacterium]
MKPLPLTAETQAVFVRIRTYDLALRVFGMSQSQAWRLVEARVENRINAAGVAVQERNQYRSYMWEVLKAFRTETGEPLVRALELAIGKWANLGLAPALLQELLCVCFLRFEQVGYAMPATQAKPAERKRGPKPRRLPRRCYEKALNKGRVSRRRSGKLEEQIAGHREGSAHAAVIADRLRPVLAERGIPGDRFVGCFAFAQKPGRYARNYSGETLRMAASDLIDLYEAKHLDRDVLLAIAAILFGVNVGS